MDEEVIKIEDIIYALKKRWLMILAITVATTVVAAAVSFFLIKPKYEAKVKVFIGKEETKKGDSGYDNNDIAMYQKLMKTYAEVIKTKDLIKDALWDIKQDTDQTNVARVLEGLTVSPSADTQIMEITYGSTDKQELIPVINSITEVFMDESLKLIPNGNIQVIQRAESPENPVSPNKGLNTIIGFMLGLMISIGLAFLLEYLDNTVKNRDELEGILGIPVLGMIPNLDETKKHKSKKVRR